MLCLLISFIHTLGVKTQTPPQSTKRKQAPVADNPGRPKVQRTLHFHLEEVYL